MTDRDPSHAAGDPVERLLDDCLAAEQTEWQSAVDAACEAHPQHRDELRRRFALLQSVGMTDATPFGAARQEFGGFELLDVIGRGGMGIVHRAVQKSTGRQVALKLVRPDLLGQDQARRRFQREIEAVSSLDHPGICTVYEAGAVDDVPFVAMRHIDGVTMAQWLADAESQQTGTGGESEFASGARRGLEATLAVFEQIARALHAAHEGGVLHRDIKPGNIMIDGDGQPVVLDFGLARTDDSGEDLTMTADQLGTPAYMAPEQIAGTRSVDRRTDVNALGVTLYEFLARRRPFTAPTREALYREILAGRPTALDRVAKRIPRDLAIVVQTAMAVEPDRRYETAEAFADDLKRVRELHPIVARRPSVAERITRWARRQPVVAGLLVALLVVAGASAWLAIVASQNAAAAELAQQEAESEAENARQEAVTAGRMTDFLVDLFEIADGSSYRGSTITAREVLDQGFRRIERDLVDEPLIQARLMATMGKVYQYLSAYDRARELSERALAIRQQAGAMPMELAISERNLGELEHSMQLYNDARRHYDAALAILQRSGFARHREAANTIELIGRLESDIGNFEASAARLQEALALRETLPQNDLDLANSHQSIGLLSAASNDVEKGILAFGKAIELRSRALGETSGRMAELHHGMANMRWMHGEFDKARESTEKALQITRDAFGESHIGVPSCLSMLGTLAADRGDLETARTRFRDAAAAFERTLGPKNRAVATQLHNLGTVEAELGNADEALQLVERAFAMRRELLEPINPELATSYIELGNLAFDRGDVKAAVDYFEKAYAIYVKAVPHAEATRRTAEKLANCHQRLGNQEAAATWRERAR